MQEDVSRWRALKRSAASTQAGRRMRRKNLNGEHLSRVAVNQDEGESGEQALFGARDDRDLGTTQQFDINDNDLFDHTQQVAGPSTAGQAPYDPTNVFASACYPHTQTDAVLWGSQQDTYAPSAPSGHFDFDYLT